MEGVGEVEGGGGDGDAEGGGGDGDAEGGGGDGQADGGGVVRKQSSWSVCMLVRVVASSTQQYKYVKRFLIFLIFIINIMYSSMCVVMFNRRRVEVIF